MDNLSPSRRSVAKSVAWMAPAVTIAAAAPRLSASSPIRIDPGINGWVLNSPTRRGDCRWHLEVDSTLDRTGPDGAPFGLYLYDIEPQTTVVDASMTYWVIGDQTASWSTYGNHSRCWSGPARGNPQRKSDGLTYTPYTWTYTCAITSADVSSDGRLRLGGFHVRASFQQSRTLCNDVTYWTQRSVVVDPDGPGPQSAETLTFKRRNGTRGGHPRHPCACSRPVGSGGRRAHPAGELTRRRALRRRPRR